MRSGVDERQLRVRRRLERHAVQRGDADAAGSPRGARAWSSRRATANSHPGWRASARTMYRSRVTFAMIEAAAIAALVASPSTIARRGWPSRSPSAKPSDRQDRARAARPRSSAARSAAMFVLCSPRVSMLWTLRETTATLAATRRTTGYSSSRASWSCCLESLSARSVADVAPRRRSRSNRTPAATSGPARQPRPASSAPATKRCAEPAVVAQAPAAGGHAPPRLRRRRGGPAASRWRRHHR